MTRALSRKLGLKPGLTVTVIGRPCDVILDFDAPAGADVILTFVACKADVPPRLTEALPLYARGKALWFAYPKKSGRAATDISRDQGWDALTANDLLPVTQVAIDDNWSALRFRYRDEIKTLTRKS